MTTPTIPPKLKSYAVIIPKITHYPGQIAGELLSLGTGEFDMFDVTDTGADPTGQADSREAIQRAIDLNRGGAIHFPRGVYLLASRLSLPSGTQLVGDKDATIKAAASLKDGMIWTEFGAKSLGVRGLIFDQSEQGTPPSGAWDILTLDGVDDVVIHNCTFTGGATFGGDSHIMIGHSTRVRIAECLFENASDEGIYVSGERCFGVVITHNHFTGCGSGTLQTGYCIGIKQKAKNTIIQGNTFDSAKYGIFHERGIVGSDPGSHSVISGNVFRNMSVVSVLLGKSDYSVVSSNRFSSTPNSVAIEVQGSSFCSISGNVFEENHEIGIRFRVWEAEGVITQCKSNIVSGNVHKGKGGWIEELDATTGNVIRYTVEQLKDAAVELNVRA